MFETFEEAFDTNSECAFCGKDKFALVHTEVGRYDLKRCVKEDCDRHCSWDHEGEPIYIDLGGPDVVSIASGWGK